MKPILLKLRPRSVKNPATVRDILLAMSEGPSVKPVMVPCSFTRCDRPAASTLARHIEQLADDLGLHFRRRAAYIEAVTDLCSECDALELRHRYQGTNQHYCTRADSEPCPWKAYDWMPSPAPIINPASREFRFRHDIWTQRILLDVRDVFDAAKSRDDLVGACARAWDADDWSAVDALREGELVAFRNHAIDALSAHISATLKARYYPEGQHD